MEVSENHFQTEEEAVAEAKALGLHTITVDVPADNNEPHWHDFDSMLYILEGELRVIETDSGALHICRKGDRLNANGYTAHNEVTKGYRAVIGLSKPFDQLGEPLNKPLPISSVDA